MGSNRSTLIAGMTSGATPHIRACAHCGEGRCPSTTQRCGTRHPFVDCLGGFSRGLAHVQRPYSNRLTTRYQFPESGGRNSSMTLASTQ